MGADGIERFIKAQPQRLKGLVVLPLHTLVDLRETDALHAAHGVGKIAVDNRLADADAFKDLRRLIGLDGGDAHFCRNLHKAAQDRVVIVIDRHAHILIQHPAL